MKRKHKKKCKNKCTICDGVKREKELFDEIMKIEASMKCNFVDDMDQVTIYDLLQYLKRSSPKIHNQLIKLYLEYYGDKNKFWEDEE